MASRCGKMILVILVISRAREVVDRCVRDLGATVAVLADSEES